MRVGTWSFSNHQAQLNSGVDLTLLEQWLDALPDKSRTIAKLGLVGCLSLTEKARLDALLERERDVLAGLLVWERRSDLVVRPEPGDLVELGLTGFAETTVAQLATAAAGEGDSGVVAQDALSLLYRLAVSA